MEKIDNVNHPKHYAPKFKCKDFECLTITEHLPFCLGNAFKYVWRAGDKGGYDKAMEDLDKALFYLDRAKDCGDYAHESNLKTARILWKLVQPEDTARWHVLDYLLYPGYSEPEATWMKKLREEVSEATLVKVRKESLYNKMNKVLQLYRGCEWNCNTSLTYDEGGELVPSTVVSLGRSFSDGFAAVVIDDKGVVLGYEKEFETLPEGSYVVGDWSLEASPEEVMVTICDELLKRKEGK